MNHLQQIQQWMKTNSIDLFLINRTDEFLSEYIAPYAERLQWISNFSGSAGRAAIFQDRATIFVDGRYTSQVHQQVDNQYFIIKHLQDYWSWLEKNIKTKIEIGVDPFLVSNIEIKKFKDILKGKKSSIRYLEKNPIDILWNDQPSHPSSKAFIHEEHFAGKSSKDKLHKVQSLLQSTFIDYYILTSLDSIAWLLNIRGNDIEYTPLVLSFAIVPKSGKIEFFVDGKKINNIRKKLENLVNFHPFQGIENYIKSVKKSRVVGLDESNSAYIFKKICNDTNLTVNYLLDPCIYLKAQKNIIELAGAKKANERDGVSITKFLYWLKNKALNSSADEIIAKNYLYSLRKNNEFFYSLSFDTISAFGKNAALPHYRVTPESNLPFKKNNIYLVDSGAQYRDGTTDITRTVILGKSTAEQKNHFTRVLKGHIAIAKAVFEINTKGSKLDPLARKSLKEIDCDYDHGTGHGIGSFLSVHEGPQRIAKTNALSDGEIREGMILSNEPGFYKKEEYGIRTENLIIASRVSNTKLGFETISFAPFDVDLIDVRILTSKEIEWINAYHEKVYQKLYEKLNTEEGIWLRKVTKPLLK